MQKRLYLLLVLGLWCYPANASGPGNGDHSHRVVEFEQWVGKLASEPGGNRALLTSKLQKYGFTCTPSEAVQFRCVRFGCKEGAGVLWRGALHQWSVDKFLGKLRGTAAKLEDAGHTVPPLVKAIIDVVGADAPKV